MDSVYSSLITRWIMIAVPVVKKGKGRYSS